jgi:hypothetical protein
VPVRPAPSLSQTRHRINSALGLSHHLDNLAKATACLPAVHDDGAGAAPVGLVDFPAELEQGLGGLGHVVAGPGEEMELGDGAGLAGAQVLQVERAHEVVLAPDVLRDEVDLVDVVELGAFVGPVAVACRLALLRQSAQHHDDDAPLLPDELPEVRGRPG